MSSFPTEKWLENSSNNTKSIYEERKIFMNTYLGPEAKDGDYVLVLDFDYAHRKAGNYIAKVYNGKAYTGFKRNNGFGKYIHKLNAEIIIPEAYVSDEIKALIEKDIEESNAKTKK